MPQEGWTGCTNMSLEDAKELSFAFISLLVDVERIRHQAPLSELIDKLQGEVIQAQELAKKIQVFADLRDTGFNVAGPAGILSLERELPQCATYDRDFERLKVTLASQKSLIRKLKNPVHSPLEVSATLKDEISKTKRLEKELAEIKHKRDSRTSNRRAPFAELETELRKANDENQHLKARILELEGDLGLLHEKIERLHYVEKNQAAGFGDSLGTTWLHQKDDSQGERVEWLESQIQSLKDTIQTNNDIITKLNRYTIDDKTREGAGFELEQLQSKTDPENGSPGSEDGDECQIKTRDKLREENSKLKDQIEGGATAYKKLQGLIRSVQKEEKKHILEIQQLNYYVINLRKEVNKYRQDASELSAQKCAAEQEIHHFKRQFERIARRLTATVDQWRENTADQVPSNQFESLPHDYDKLVGDEPVELESSSKHASDMTQRIQHTLSTSNLENLRRDLSGQDEGVG